MMPESENKVKETNSLETPRKPRRNKKRYLIYVLILILIPSVAVAWNYYSQIQEEKRQEALDLAVLCEDNYNIEDYQDFLNKYPQSSNSRKVKQRMKQLETMAAAWEQIRNSQNVNEFIHFKENYNDSYYARLCDLKIDTLDWKNASKLNHPEAYQQYLNRHAKGAFLAQAIHAQQKVAYMSISETETDYVHEICNRFLTAMGINDTLTIQHLLTPEVETFMGISHPSSADILTCIQKNQEPYVFMTYMLPAQLNTQKTVSETNEKIYVSTFTLDQITTDNDGNEKTVKCETTVKMNKNLQIYSFTIKEN